MDDWMLDYTYDKPDGTDLGDGVHRPLNDKTLN